MDAIDLWITTFLGAHATTKAIFSILATVFGYGRAKAWWNRRNTLPTDTNNNFPGSR